MEGTQPGLSTCWNWHSPDFQLLRLFLKPQIYASNLRAWHRNQAMEAPHPQGVATVASRLNNFQGHKVGHISAVSWGAHRQLHPIQVPFPQNTPQPTVCQSRIFPNLKILELILITKLNAKWLRSAERLWHSRQLTFNWHHGSILHLCISKLGCEDIGMWSCCDSFNWKFSMVSYKLVPTNMLMNMPKNQLLEYPSLATRQKHKNTNWSDKPSHVSCPIRNPSSSSSPSSASSCDSQWWWNWLPIRGPSVNATRADLLFNPQDTKHQNNKRERERGRCWEWLIYTQTQFYHPILFHIQPNPIHPLADDLWKRKQGRTQRTLGQSRISSMATLRMDLVVKESDSWLIYINFI